MPEDAESTGLDNAGTDSDRQENRDWKLRCTKFIEQSVFVDVRLLIDKRNGHHSPSLVLMFRS